MTKFRWTLSALAAFAAFAVLGSSPASAKDGKTIFTEQKCTTCHSVDSQGIAMIKEEGEEEDSKPADLSNAGAHDAKWLKGWMEKKEQKDGKAHRKTWKGTPEDLTVLVDWLATLKK